MTRQVLPERRYAETFTLNVAMGDYKTPFQVSVGYFPPDLAYEVGEPPPKPQPAEVFIMGPKAGSSVEAVARDASVILSIALQYGAPVEVLQHSITRNARSHRRRAMRARGTTHLRAALVQAAACLASTLLEGDGFREASTVGRIAAGR
jgi:hypothetical protein